jgi:hypothetical protein
MSSDKGYKLVIGEEGSNGALSKMDKIMGFRNRVWFVCTQRLISIISIGYQVFLLGKYFNSFFNISQHNEHEFSFAINCTDVSTPFVNGSVSDMTKDYEFSINAIVPIITAFKVIDVFACLIIDYMVFKELYQSINIKYNTLFVSENRGKYTYGYIVTIASTFVVILMLATIPALLKRRYYSYSSKEGSVWFYNCSHSYIPIELTDYQDQSDCSYQIDHQMLYYKDLYIVCARVDGMDEGVGYRAYRDLLKLRNQIYSMSLVNSVITCLGIMWKFINNLPNCS